MTATVVILVATVIMFVIGKIRADVVALCAVTLLIICGILTPSEALAGFSNSAVIMMVGLFVVGGAILQTGIAKAASQKLMLLAKGNENLMYLFVVLITAVTGAFVSNTGTVALMMPIIVALAVENGTSPSKLLMPLAFASSLGGSLTLIGTPPNIIISETLADNGYDALGFFDFTPIGFICLIIGTAVMYPLTKWFLSKKGTDSEDDNKGKSLSQLANEHRLIESVRKYRITGDTVAGKTINEDYDIMGSSLVGRTLGEVNIRQRYGLNILEIRHEEKGGLMKKITQILPTADTKFSYDDIIYVQGDGEKMTEFAEKYVLEKLPFSNLDFYDLGIAEIVVMPQSKLVGTRLKNAQFREHYDVNILSIRRDGELIGDNLPDIKLKSGDTLLIQGQWENIKKMDADETEWVILGRPDKMADKVTLDYKAPIAGVIMLAMIAMMVFDFIPVAGVTAVIIAGLLMVLCGCFRSVDAAYKTINWESIVLIAAMMPMSTALMKTGTSSLISHTLVEAMGAIGPSALLCGIYFTTTILSLFISNTATAVLMAPIALTSAVEMGLSPYPFLFAVTLGASMCFASPFATPPNALVMHAGQYTFADYVKVGLPLQLIIGVAMTLILPLIFPF